MLTEMLGPAGYAAHGVQIEGNIQMVFLLGWSLGGLIFGIFADRFGRVRTLALTITLYCLFTGLTALCQTPLEVGIVRFLTALGIGGEWAAGAALVAEAFPDKARAPAASFLQSAAAFGPILASFAGLSLASASWRWLFVVGIVPAMIAIYVRLQLTEPERSLTHESKAPISELFGSPPLRRNAFIALAMGFAGIAGAGTVSYWMPNLVNAASHGVSNVVLKQRTAFINFPLHAGTILGVIFFPWLCQKIGRKKAFAAFFVLSPLSIFVAAAFTKTGDFSALCFSAPLMSFFSIGLSAGFALYFPELFPTAVRATGSGFAYNTGRILTAFVPPITGALILKMGGNVGAGVVASGLVYVVGLAAIPFAPETRGRPLPD
jgi:MFS family permease